ncbi:unnamed protein product [Clonostachys chloroleuca]|uniref:LYC1 C-terminal domain-containing protein n=1 Tax=Clonostachys chloroleuca TaxID=1926264 RepID=A0AA35Q7M9_9HYPO|nr:unnamed protein product [Clonostachys chloroleuca]
MTSQLPGSNSTTLHLCHPTPDECVTIWTDISALWKDSLTLPVFLRESSFLATVPLARYGGMTQWILVDKYQPPNHRRILTSCESFRKRCLQSDQDGNTKEAVIHGIASVFCAPQYRRRGYAGRHMAEMAKALRSWQAKSGPPIMGSILYSDVGKEYYAKLGWRPNLTNFHFEFPPGDVEWPSSVHPVATDEIADLCRRDEIMIRGAMSAPEPSIKTRAVILPDVDHMLWHISKEEFASKFIFGGSIPDIKGAIAGRPGKQVWAIWTRRYYDHPDAESPNNVLYILRLVIESDKTANKVFSCVSSEDTAAAVDPDVLESFKSIIQAAQHQAKAWRLDRVKVWEPSVLAQRLIDESSLEYQKVERQTECIASCLWFGDDESDGLTEEPVLINNEHYAWC